MIRPGAAPAARAAVTYSVWRIATTDPWTIRATWGARTRPIARTSLSIPGPRIAMNISPITRAGNDIRRSTTLMRRSSTRPPK